MTRRDVNTNTKAHSFFPLWVRQRELRQQIPLGHLDVFYKSLYSSISPCHSWEGGETPRREHGGLFDLEFSPDGTQLVATCEMFSFLIFDPLSQRLIHTVQNVHAGYVTHVKFLDSGIFATGGEEGEVFLWDTRNLKSRFRTLLGHSETIANIEFSRTNGMLITSAQNGISYIWDMKTWNQREEHKRLFMSYALSRLRLNPDETKMIISTSHGYLLIVHELDLNTLVQDLVKFELQTFGFEYLHKTNSNSAHNSSWYLSRNRSRNRVEIVADFPNTDCMISALEIHPRGWCVISRGKNEDSKEEWTCVHDIQEREASESGSVEGSGVRGPPCPQRLEGVNEERCSARGGWRNTRRASVGFCNDSCSELQDAAFSQERGAAGRRSVCPAEGEARNHPPRPSSAPPERLELPGLGSHPAAIRVLDHLLPRLHPKFTEFNRRVHVRCPRLTHYIEEPFVSGWYIESLGISADGRLVSSPFERGIRLFAFSPECSEQSVSWCGTKPRPLYELSTLTSHSASVHCTKFSPRHCLLASGCADGNLSWYQPVV